MRILPFFALVVLALTAPTQAASLGKFKGTYKGSHTASGSIAGYSGSTSGSSTAKITLAQKNQAATLNLSGTDSSSGVKYTATIHLKKNGTASTNEILPGIVDLQATGTWTLSSNGKKITVKLAVKSSYGNITSTSTIQVNDKNLKIKTTANLSSSVASGRGSYQFHGKK